jgi:hypothetical protein
MVTFSNDQWTWLYKKNFSMGEIEGHKYRNSLLFYKENTPEFNQLIFSWNAFRPTKGFYRFKVRVRDAKTKNWHKWHTMSEWGVGVQRSFLDKPLFGPQFFHVRLEMPKMHLADCLCIKVEACEGAECSGLRGLFVSISNLCNFKNESVNGLKDLASFHVRHVPEFSQMTLDHPKKEVLCSPTSCSMLLSYLLKEQVDPVDFANKAHDKGLDAYGSWPFNIAHAFEYCKGDFGFYVQRLSSFQALHKLLQRKIPVVVSVRGSLEGAPKDYNDGHLLVVVGWDKTGQKIICHDPAFETNGKTCVTYPIDSFLKAWERSRRLAYVCEKN